MEPVLKIVIVEVSGLAELDLNDLSVKERLEVKSFFGSNEEYVGEYGQLEASYLSHSVEAVYKDTDTCSIAILNTPEGHRLLNELEEDNVRFYYDLRSMSVLWRVRHR